MKKACIYKASPITNDKPVEDATILISMEIPERPVKSLKEAGELYRKDAQEIVDIFCNHLPQGTRHQILIELLKRHELLYIGI